MTTTTQPPPDISSCGYVANSEISSGSYGIIYLSTDTNTGKLLAIKYIPKNDIYGIRDIGEIDVLSRIRHPNVIEAIDIITKNRCNIEGYGIVLPLAHTTLDAFWQKYLLITKDKIPIMYKILKGLQFLHDHHIIHCDIKGKNIVLKGQLPYNVEPLIIDFGLMSYAPDAKKGSFYSFLKGTPKYMAPELFLGGSPQGHYYNEAVDVWALGITFYELISESSLGITSKNTLTDIKRYFEKELVQTKEKLVLRVEDYFKAQMLELVFGMLELDPQKRLTMAQILLLPIFQHQPDIQGREKLPPYVKTSYPPNLRDYLNIISYIYRTYYPNNSVAALFLSIDLLQRYRQHLVDKNDVSLLACTCACIWMGVKSYNDGRFLKVTYITEAGNKIEPKLTADQIVAYEAAIISEFRGILNRPYFFDRARSFSQLKKMHALIYDVKYLAVYPLIDIEAWITKIAGGTTGEDKSKDVTVQEFYSS